MTSQSPAPAEEQESLFPKGSYGPAETLRLVLEICPGERPLQPEFGCAIHQLDERNLQREELVAGLMEEALDRWLPALRVQRVEVDSLVDGRLSARAWIGGRCESFVVSLRKGTQPNDVLPANPAQRGGES